MLYIYGLFASAVLFLAVYAAVRAMAPDEDWDGEAPEKGFVAFKRQQLADSNQAYVMLRILIFIPTYWIGTLDLDKVRAGLKVKLARAGHPGGFTPDEFLATCVCAGISGMLFGIAFTAVGLGGASPLLAMIPGMISAYLPFLYMEDLIIRRLSAVNRHLPFVLDLLSLSLGAGLDFNTALDSVVSKESQKGPLIEELHYVLQEIRLGVTRREALLNMSDRIQSEYVTSVVGAVVQAEAMGTPLSRILQVQAQANRLKRTQRAEKIAAEATIKILFPILMILIAVFLTMFGPLIVRYMNGDLV
ncbi:MAG: type II secretion system F family protein [Myxococcota bacterium]|jgi:tight adherence protein C|nr:type II secretion system F family protein [Myxococcota bacterium]